MYESPPTSPFGRDIPPFWAFWRHTETCENNYSWNRRRVCKRTELKVKKRISKDTYGSCRTRTLCQTMRNDFIFKSSLTTCIQFQIGEDLLSIWEFSKALLFAMNKFSCFAISLDSLVNHILDNLYLLLYHDTQKCYVRNSNWTDFPSTHCHFRFQIGKKKNFFLFQAKSLRV